MNRLRGPFAIALICAQLSPALAQMSPGTSPLSGPKGGTNNGFMQFSGPAGALKTYTLPNASDTLAALGQIQSWTGAQSFGDGKLILLGSSSGSSTVKAPATGGGTATLFPGSDTIAGLAATQALTNKTFNCASNTCTVRLGSDITGFGTGVAAALAANLNASGGIPSPTPTRAGDILYWNGSVWTTLAGNNSGTQVLQENSTGVPSWVAGGGTGTVTSVGCGTGLSGDTITTTGTCNLALTNTTLQASPSNPTGTTSATGVMMGLGTTCKLTPTYSTRIKVEFIGTIKNSGATGTSTIKVAFGTSTAPSNAAAATGTQVGNSVLVDENGTVSLNNSFVNGGIITGLTAGTAYWFDINLASSGGNTGTLTSLSCNAFEF